MGWVFLVEEEGGTIFEKNKGVAAAEAIKTKAAATVAKNFMARGKKKEEKNNFRSRAIIPSEP